MESARRIYTIFVLAFFASYVYILHAHLLTRPIRTAFTFSLLLHRLLLLLCTNDDAHYVHSARRSLIYGRQDINVGPVYMALDYVHVCVCIYGAAIASTRTYVRSCCYSCASYAASFLPSLSSFIPLLGIGIATIIRSSPFLKTPHAHSTVPSWFVRNVSTRQLEDRP